jgi:protein SCO1
MAQVSRRNLFGGLAAPVAALKTGAAADFTPHKFAPRLPGREMMRRRYFPNVELVTHKNEKVRFYDDVLKDKIVILNMMYADCEGICPTLTTNLKHVQRLLEEQIDHEIFIYSMTVKPENDTPKKLAEYAEMHGLQNNSHWTFLTGKLEIMDMLRHSIGFADPDPKLDQDKARHSGMIRYGNEPMALWGTCQGSGKPEWMAQEIGFAIPRQFKRNPAVNE